MTSFKRNRCLGSEINVSREDASDNMFASTTLSYMTFFELVFSLTAEVADACLHLNPGYFGTITARLPDGSGAGAWFRVYLGSGGCFPIFQ